MPVPTKNLVQIFRDAAARRLDPFRALVHSCREIEDTRNDMFNTIAVPFDL